MPPSSWFLVKTRISSLHFWRFMRSEVPCCSFPYVVLTAAAPEAGPHMSKTSGWWWAQLLHELMRSPGGKMATHHPTSPNAEENRYGHEIWKAKSRLKCFQKQLSRDCCWWSWRKAWLRTHKLRLRESPLDGVSSLRAGGSMKRARTDVVRKPAAGATTEVTFLLQ